MSISFWNNDPGKKNTVRDTSPGPKVAALYPVSATCVIGIYAEVSEGGQSRSLQDPITLMSVISHIHPGQDPGRLDRVQSCSFTSFFAAPTKGAYFGLVWFKVSDIKSI